MPANPVFHGTSRATANTIVGPPASIDVSRGNGEFGVGFYCGSSKSAALMWASARSPEPAIVSVSVSEGGYAGLRVRELSADQAATMRTQARRAIKIGEAYVAAVDVVVGPVVGRPNLEQVKFESATAQNTLNGQHATLQVL
jgi:hypothetical protein